MFFMLHISQVFPLGFKFFSNPLSPSPHIVQIADGLLCIPSVKVSKYQLIKFTFIYRLLSTAYNVSPYQSNKTSCSTSDIQILFS